MSSSYCLEEGKDKIVFLSEKDASVKSEITLSDSKDDAAPSLITPDGEINWNCPCLGGMPVGPCGVEFREAFSCFHYSEAEPKGSDCLKEFTVMQDCMKDYPELYEEKNGKDDDTVESFEDNEESASEES